MLGKKRSMKTLSRQQPFPSMLCRMPWAVSSATKPLSVNWLPWSVG